MKSLDDLLAVLKAIGLDLESVFEPSLIDPPGNAPFKLIPGSSTLAMLLAMPSEIRQRSTFGTWLDTSSLSTRLISSFEMLPCDFMIMDTAARPSICLIISDHSACERYMVTLTLDDAPALPLLEMRPDASRIVVDSYELASAAFSRSLENLCSSTSPRLYVSLGGAEVLHKEVSSTIGLMLERGWVAALAGTDDEFRAIDLATSPRGAFQDPARLITYGDKGMTGIVHGEIVHVEAKRNLSGDVYPSGAGDTVAGVFFAGLAAHIELRRTLELARDMAALVVSRPESWVVNDAQRF